MEPIEQAVNGHKPTVDKIQCPVCGVKYTPNWPSQEDAETANDSIGIEQHISGICSFICFEENINPDTMILAS